MNLGLQLYGPIACGKMNLAEMFRGLKEVGFGMVEPCITLDGKMNNPSFWNMSECEKWFPLLKELGLEVISCHVASENLDDSIPEICRLADEFGVKQFVVGTGELSQAAIEQRSALYRKIADILKDHNAELLIHNGKPDIAAKIQGRTAYEYMVDCCLGKVCMQFDSGWCARGGEDPMEFINKNQGCIKSFHYKDFNMNNDTDVDVCIGDGTLDNPGFKKFASSKGIPQFVDADTYSDVISDAKKSYQYLQKVEN